MSDVLCLATAVALDRFATVEAFAVGRTNRPTAVVELAGGKAVNVARTVDGLGGTAHVVGVVGGAAGDAVVAQLATTGVTSTWVRGTNPTRQCLAVYDDTTGQVTEIFEPAQPLSPVEWSEFATLSMRAATAHRGVTVVSGRLPAGVSGVELARLVSAVMKAGCRVMLDCQGDGAAEAALAGAEWLKINEHEAAELLFAWGLPLPASADLARAVADRTGGSVVVTLGARGAAAATVGGPCFEIGQVPLPDAHATGSGDAFLAGLALSLARQEPPQDSLHQAAAAARANAARRDAGCVTAGQAAAQLGGVTVRSQPWVAGADGSTG